jgi:hypothetical protein
MCSFSGHPDFVVSPTVECTWGGSPVLAPAVPAPTVEDEDTEAARTEADTATEDTEATSTEADSVTSDSSVPTLTSRTFSLADSTVDALTYRSFDTESDDDSYMPRRRRTTDVKSNRCDWEFLDDVSLGSNTHETENATESDSSFGVELPPSDWSAALDSMASSDASASSLASAATLVTFTTEASKELFKPTVPPDVLQQLDDDSVGKKAVKADDAEVPVHLWNSRVRADCSEELKTNALDGCRDMGLQVFRRALYLDCIEYLALHHGSDWQTQPQRKSRFRLTELGREVDAIRNILWHANETNFFEYYCGSRLHHIRWPVFYRKLARDGVPVKFEKAGPSTKQQQPVFADPNVKAQVREKILKVIRRRYMVEVTTNLDIKSLIKYFAVPKGLKDIRIVYDATASGLNEAV